MWKDQNVENWLPFVKDLTFKTFSLPISLQEGVAMVHHYQEYINHSTGRLSQEERDLLVNLEKKIDRLLTEHLSDTKVGAFVRLSTRSPKDAVLVPGRPCEKLKVVLKTAYASMENRDVHKEYSAMMDLGTKALRIFSGQDALDMLLNSERAFLDLLLASEFPNEWNMQLIFREWIEIKYSMEFRCFVFNKKLNAISQYDPFVFFPELQDKAVQTDIQQRIAVFFDTVVKDRLSMDNYIIDFAVVSDKILIIELNSWATSTGSACFSWSNDRVVLENGPLQIRVATSPPELTYP